MSNVMLFPTQRIVSQESAVELLERYLERARNGELVAVGIAAVRDDGRAQYAHSEPENALSLIGAIKLLETYVALSLDEEGE